MVEHRGVGMSRHDDAGADLPPEAHRRSTRSSTTSPPCSTTPRLDTAVLYGTSYGTYLAAGFGVRHPDRVHAMILDSPLLSADDIDAVASHPPAAVGRRRARDRGVGAQGAPAGRRRRAHARRPPSSPPTCTGSAGPTLLRPPARPAAERVATGCGVPSASAPGCCSSARRRTTTSPTWSGRIGYRELNYGAVPDGQPLDPGRGVARIRPPVTSISSPSPTTWWRRCRSSPGPLSSSPVAAT